MPTAIYCEGCLLCLCFSLKHAMWNQFCQSLISMAVSRLDFLFAFQWLSWVEPAAVQSAACLFVQSLITPISIHLGHPSMQKCEIDRIMVLMVFGGQRNIQTDSFIYSNKLVYFFFIIIIFKNLDMPHSNLILWNFPFLFCDQFFFLLPKANWLNNPFNDKQKNLWNENDHSSWSFKWPIHLLFRNWYIQYFV